MANPVNFHIAAVPDQQLLAMMRAFCAKTGLQFSAATLTLWGDVATTINFEPDSAKALPTLLETSTARLIKNATFPFPKVDIRIDAEPESEPRMRVQVTPRNDPKPKDEEFIVWAHLAKVCLHEFIPGIAFKNILGEETNRHYAAREATILQLDSITQELFKKTADYEVAARQRIEREETKLRKTYDDLTKTQSERNDARQTKQDELDLQLAGRQKELEEKAKELDRKENKVKRRESIEALIRKLDHDSEAFELEVTSGTRSKRRLVFGFTLVFIGCLLVLTIGLYIQEEQRGISATSWIRPTLATISFLLASVFFLKWLNNWADRHATEEFRLKRMLLDVRRTNLLIEAALEWETETSKAIPDQLLNTLSRNLFSEAGGSADPASPAESLVSLLAHTNANFELKLPAAELKASGANDKKATNKD